VTPLSHSASRRVASCRSERRSFLCVSVVLSASSLTGRPTLVGKALSFTHEHSLFSVSFLFVYQSTPLRSHAQWMTIKCIPKVWLEIKLQQLV